MQSVTKEEHGTEAIRRALESAGDRFLMVWDSKDHPTAGLAQERCWYTARI